MTNGKYSLYMDRQEV